MIDDGQQATLIGRNGQMWGSTTLTSLIGMAYEVPEDLWLINLGRYWTSFDDISLNIEAIFFTPFGERLSFPGCERSPIFEMMTKDEVDFLNALPEQVEIFRGGYGHNKRGFSWSLDKETACLIPFIPWYRQEDEYPWIVKATIAKRYIAAVKLSLDEFEVITAPSLPKIISARRMTTQQSERCLQKIHGR